MFETKSGIFPYHFFADSFNIQKISLICKADGIHANIHDSSYRRTESILVFIQLPITEKSVKVVHLYRLFFITHPL